MLSYEWRELEALCHKITDLRERRGDSRKSRNTGLTASIDEEIAKAQRQRELLVHHISSRLGTVAAAGHQDDPDSPVHRARRKRAVARHTESDIPAVVGFEEE
jgi:hypothetical protein